MELKRAATITSAKGPEACFTGTVRVEMLSNPPAPARATVGNVTFGPGARSAWHTHPLGQTLVVTAGCGWTQCEGGPIVQIQAGDVIWCPPGHKHWHGATPTTAMTHLAITEQLDGVAVVWLEKVTDAQYLAGPPADAAEHAHAC
jgi:quercetin dioxygenase-like cupin family protein